MTDPRIVQLEPAAATEMRRLHTELQQALTNAAAADVRLGLYVKGICHGLGEPFPPTALEPDLGQLHYATETGPPEPEDTAPPEAT